MTVLRVTVVLLAALLPLASGQAGLKSSGRRLKDGGIVSLPLSNPSVLNLPGAGGPLIGNISVGGDGGDQPVSTTDPTGPVRLYVITKWAEGQNTSASASAEFQLAKQCKATIAAGISGINSNQIITNLWGSYLKVLDFQNGSDFRAYQTCWEAHKAAVEANVVDTIYALVDIQAKDVGSLILSNAYLHVSIMSTGVAAAPTLQAYANSIVSSFTGPAEESNVGQSHNSYITDMWPTKKTGSVGLDVAFKEVQGALAYYFYKNGYPAGSAVSALPLFTQLQSLLTAPAYDVEVSDIKKIKG